VAESSQQTAALVGSPEQAGKTARVPIPLSRRRLDLLFVAFFLLNLLFITYIVDIEQIIIPDPAHFQYPIWPPAPLVDLIHWYGRTYDPLLLARPPWWKATIWIDSLFFGPFYAVAIYAYLKGKDWIRIPSIIWASVLLYPDSSLSQNMSHYLCMRFDAGLRPCTTASARWMSFTRRM
jgi:hypothetical protein